MASKLTLKNCVRGRAKTIQLLLVPTYFIKAKFGRHPECFGPVYGIQAIIQESYTNAYLLNQKIIGVKIFWWNKSGGHAESFG